MLTQKEMPDNVLNIKAFGRGLFFAFINEETGRAKPSTNRFVIVIQ
jgi:hypothetical protein